MLPQKRLESLQSKKAILAKRIEDAEKCPSMDSYTLRDLKRQKLELNDVIQEIRADGTFVH